MGLVESLMRQNSKVVDTPDACVYALRDSIPTQAINPSPVFPRLMVVRI